MNADERWLWTIRQDGYMAGRLQRVILLLEVLAFELDVDMEELENRVDYVIRNRNLVYEPELFHDAPTVD